MAPIPCGSSMKNPLSSFTSFKLPVTGLWPILLKGPHEFGPLRSSTMWFYILQYNTYIHRHWITFSRVNWAESCTKQCMLGQIGRSESSDVRSVGKDVTLKRHSLVRRKNITDISEFVSASLINTVKLGCTLYTTVLWCFPQYQLVIFIIFKWNNPTAPVIIIIIACDFLPTKFFSNKQI